MLISALCETLRGKATTGFQQAFKYSCGLRRSRLDLHQRTVAAFLEFTLRGTFLHQRGDVLCLKIVTAAVQMKVTVEHLDQQHQHCSRAGARLRYTTKIGMHRCHARPPMRLDALHDFPGSCTIEFSGYRETQVAVRTELNVEGHYGIARAVRSYRRKHELRLAIIAPARQRTGRIQ